MPTKSTNADDDDDDYEDDDDDDCNNDDIDIDEGTLDDGDIGTNQPKAIPLSPSPFISKCIFVRITITVIHFNLRRKTL